MEIKFREFLKNRKNKKINQKELGKRIKGILQSFKEERINFCILRNYKNIKKEKDIDLLVTENEKIDKIMNKFGLYKRYSYGNFMSYKGNGLWFDFKIGCLSYCGFRYKNAQEILKNKEQYGYFYILNKEDEFIHLILHCVLQKGYFKNEYKRRISYLLWRIDKNIVINELGDKFSIHGITLFDLIRREEYKKVLYLRKNLLRSLKNIRDLPTRIMVNFIQIFWAKVRKIFFKNI